MMARRNPRRARGKPRRRKSLALPLMKKEKSNLSLELKALLELSILCLTLKLIDYV